MTALAPCPSAVPSSAFGYEPADAPARPSAPEGVDLEVVFWDHAPRLHAAALRMLGNEADADDVTQEVFLQAVRRLDTFRGDASLATWLYRIMVNAVLALRRKRSSARERHLGEALAAVFDDRTTPARRTACTDPGNAVMTDELRGRIEDALGKLPPMYRDPLVLADFDGLPNTDLCEVLGLSLPAVKSRLHRARLMMRESLLPYLGG